LITEYSYWVFRDVLSEKNRNKIKRTAKKSGYNKGEITTDSTDDISKTRNTDVAFSSESYLYDLFSPLICAANEGAGWKYDIDWFEPVQVARYRKNQHYAWHTDGASDHFGSNTLDHPGGENFAGKVRKLSLVACLSNGYVGGDLELASQKPEEEDKIFYPEMKAGDVIIFPSYVFHRSTPVTKGVKYSAAIWCLGPPFK
jgi:predicted 2-oxoglutarate/Fe(II)-dependent dioxygenase YbiX